ncbi:MAG: hypothetical protein K2J47_03775 [Ruminococcus sp.]|nr:hypothetical protein [Ruminococcus sp.]
MKLSKQDSDLFFDLWFSLLDYTNKKYGIDTSTKIINRKTGVNLTSAFRISDKIWEDTSVIDDYLAENELPEDEQKILKSWHYRIKGTFVIERHLKKGAVIIDNEDNVYIVKGLTQSIRDLTCDFPTPVYIKGTLLPFKNVIITDGLIMPYNVIIGGNMRAELKELYMEAKRNDWIIEKMNIDLLDENRHLLKFFKSDISNLSEKTIDNHMKIVQWYLIYYLANQDLRMQDGLNCLDDFFNREVSGSPNEIKKICTSIKKFYKSMAEHNKISEDDYKSLCSEIKENFPRWAEECNL